ncbi:hypothetical protein VNO78_35164 [Psophocarpus tetragonolobus]|uniref:Uncharacterized protein n=1 Tax=Psophocarpus tetragonolobus TaxID=3891 RepID=A0AAN9NN14_PSOTE
MKEEKKSFLLFFLFPPRERGSYGGRGNIRALFFKSSTASRITSGTLSGGGGERLGLGLPIPIGPHKGTGAVERFHIAEPKGSTSVRDRSMSSRPRSIEKYLCTISGSLLRKIELGWGSTM